MLFGVYAGARRVAMTAEGRRVDSNSCKSMEGRRDICSSTSATLTDVLDSLRGIRLVGTSAVVALL